MPDDPYGLAVRALFSWLFLGPARAPDLVALGALVAGLAAAVALPLPVRPVPRRPDRWRRAGRAYRGLALLAGLGVPGLWDLLAGRAALGALHALCFGSCYAVARAARGEGLLARILLAGPGSGYFGDAPAGVVYFAAPGLAQGAALVALLLFVANVPLTLRRARAAGAFRLEQGPPPSR